MAKKQPECEETEDGCILGEFRQEMGMESTPVM